MYFRAKKGRVFAYRHILLCTQILFFFVLFLSDYVPRLLTQAAYCVVVFTSPLLLLIYGFRYIKKGNWYLAAVPFFAEGILAVLFVGAMIYGIREDMPSAAVFAKLLAAYIVDAALCIVVFLLSKR